MKNGFSLIESLASVAIISACTMLAVPAFTDLHHRTELDTSLDSVHSMLLLVRGKALDTGNYAVICGSENGFSCGENFQKTLLAFVDSNGNGQLDGNETIEQALEIPKSISLKLTSFSGKPIVYFQPTGTTEGGNGSILICRSGGDNQLARKIAWTRAGRVKRSAMQKDGFHHYNNRVVQCED